VFLQFWRNFELVKFPQNFCRQFWQYFASSLNPKNISWEITYTILSNIFIFSNILKLKLLSKFWNVLQNCWRIQSLMPKLFAKFWCCNTKLLVELWISCYSVSYVNTKLWLFVLVRRYLVFGKTSVCQMKNWWL